MSYTAFGTQVAMVAGALALLILLVPPFALYAPFAWGSWLFFLNMTVLLFVFAKQSILSSNKNHFSMIFFGGTIIKMLLSLSYLLWYKIVKLPASSMFIAPFLTCFVVFTVFEIIFLTKIARE
ncbi:MAG: hypothetical protein RI894_1779 [Bacteroidota bacterium]|jgi:hypothetical protein